MRVCLCCCHGVLIPTDPCLCCCQGGLNNGIQDLLTAMESGLADESHPFYSLTPSTPLPSNINCYVEIPAVSKPKLTASKHQLLRGNSSHKYTQTNFFHFPETSPATWKNSSYKYTQTNL